MPREVVRRRHGLGSHRDPGECTASRGHAARTRPPRKAMQVDGWSTRTLSRALPHGARQGRDQGRRKPPRKRHRRYVDPPRTKSRADLIDRFSESRILHLKILIGRLSGCVLILFRMSCGNDDRPTRCRPRLRAESGSPGGRARLRLAAPVQSPTTHPLRAPRRPPPGLARTRLPHHLLPPPQNSIPQRSVTLPSLLTTVSGRPGAGLLLLHVSSPLGVSDRGPQAYGRSFGVGYRRI